MDPKYDTPTSNISSIIKKAIGIKMNPKCWEMTKRHILSCSSDLAFSAEDKMIEKILRKLKGDGERTVGVSGEYTSTDFHPSDLP